MGYDPTFDHRRSVRLPKWDYGESGAYFITVCTYNRCAPLGQIESGGFAPSRLGVIVAEEWARTQTLRAGITLDEFVVMPNHVHGIIFLARPTVGAQRAAPLRTEPTRTFAVSPASLGAVVRAFNRPQPGG